MSYATKYTTEKIMELINNYHSNLKQRLNGMQAQVNRLQERYNEEDYEAFFGSLKKEKEEREAQLDESLSDRCSINKRRVRIPMTK